MELKSDMQDTSSKLLDAIESYKQAKTLLATGDEIIRSLGVDIVCADFARPYHGLKMDIQLSKGIEIIGDILGLPVLTEVHFLSTYKYIIFGGAYIFEIEGET